MSELEPTRTYSNPNANDVVRRMLDERGVEYTEDLGYREFFWNFGEHGKARVSSIGTRGLVQMIVTGITPEQAIAATLGAGTCKRVMDSIDPFTMWVCDHCRHPLDTSENFCGGCGRKVVSDG